MIYMTLLYLIYLGHAEFFETSGSKSLEITNESVFVLIQYNFVLLQNLVWEPEVRENIGHVLIGLTGSLLILNMIVIVVVSIKALIWKLHLRKVKKQKLQKHKIDIAEKKKNEPLKPIEEKKESSSSDSESESDDDESSEEDLSKIVQPDQSNNIKLIQCKTKLEVGYGL